MKKNTPASSAESNVWDDESQAPTAEEIVSVAKQVAAKAPKAIDSAEYDIDGLMTDFPTAKELERFVYDETGIVLNLKGRANKLKYQVAMDVLNGIEVDAKFIGNENPYVEKSDMIPEEPLKPVPERDSKLPPHSQIQNTFYSPVVPHPDSDARAQDKKCFIQDSYLCVHSQFPCP